MYIFVREIISLLNDTKLKTTDFNVILYYVNRTNMEENGAESLWEQAILLLLGYWHDYLFIRNKYANICGIVVHICDGGEDTVRGQWVLQLWQELGGHEHGWHQDNRAQGQILSYWSPSNCPFISKPSLYATRSLLPSAFHFTAPCSNSFSVSASQAWQQ